MSFADGLSHQVIAASQSRFGMRHYVPVSAAVGALGAVGGAIAFDNDKLTVPAGAVIGVGVGAGLVKWRSRSLPPTYALNFRRGLADSMVRNGVLELRQGEWNPYSEAFTRYLDNAKRELADLPEPLRDMQSMHRIQVAESGLSYWGPWGDDLWWDMAVVEVHLEHSQSMRALEALSARVPNEVPQHLQPMVQELENAIAGARNEQRMGVPYPDRATLGRIEAQIEMLEQLTAASS
jgi:hypothetical protein